MKKNLQSSWNNVWFTIITGLKMQQIIISMEVGSPVNQTNQLTISINKGRQSWFIQYSFNSSISILTREAYSN